MSKKLAAILAAGRGTRFDPTSQLPPKSLCKINDVDSTITKNIENFIELGFDKILIITGYKKKYFDKLAKQYSNVDTIYNSRYDDYGCEYSVSKISEYPCIDDYDDILIIEADVLIDKKYIQELLDNDGLYKVLVRDSKFIIDNKSVVLVDNGSYNEFVYDKNHVSVLSMIDDSSIILGESMQVWYLSGLFKFVFVDCLRDYIKYCDFFKDYKTFSGIFNLNKLSSIFSERYGRFSKLNDKWYKCIPVMVSGENWLNINTQEDLIEGRALLNVL